MAMKSIVKLTLAGIALFNVGLQVCGAEEQAVIETVADVEAEGAEIDPDEIIPLGRPEKQPEEIIKLTASIGATMSYEDDSFGENLKLKAGSKLKLKVDKPEVPDNVLDFIIELLASSSSASDSVGAEGISFSEVGSRDDEGVEAGAEVVETVDPLEPAEAVNAAKAVAALSFPTDATSAVLVDEVAAVDDTVVNDKKVTDVDVDAAVGNEDVLPTGEAVASVVEEVQAADAAVAKEVVERRLAPFRGNLSN